MGPEIAAAIIGAIASIIGAIASNVNSAKQAKNAQKYNTEMANTAHQREKADLLAANMNPILTATGGNGAASPQGVVYHPMNVFESTAFGDMGAGLSNVSNAAQLKDKKRLLSSQTSVNENTASKQVYEMKKLQTERQLVEKQIEETASRIGVNNAAQAKLQSERVGIQADNVKKTLDAKFNEHLNKTTGGEYFYQFKELMKELIRR